MSMLTLARNSLNPDIKISLVKIIIVAGARADLEDAEVATPENERSDRVTLGAGRAERSEKERNDRPDLLEYRADRSEEVTSTACARHRIDRRRAHESHP